MVNQEKEQLKKDIETFAKTYVAKISHTDIQNDKFSALGVMGNFYSLALENYPDMVTTYNDFVQIIKTTNKEKEEAYKEASNDCYAIFKQNGINYSGKYVSVGDYLYSMPRLYWDANFVDAAQAATRCLIMEMERFLKEDSVKEYLMLKEELQNGQVKFLRKGAVKKRIQELETSDLFVPRYNKLLTNMGAVKRADSQLKTSKALHRYKDALKREDKLKNPNWGTLEDFRKKLNEKASNILGMAYAKLYTDHFEVLKMSSKGAKQKLLELATQDAEYYSKYSIEGVAKNLDKYVAANSIASKLHEQWRDGRKQEDGTYAPRWKVVKDQTFITSAKEMETLPNNIRIVNGAVEQDIANTEFNDLCLDYKIENFEAALVAFELARYKYPREKAGVVGKIIHDKWLERNSWAKGSDLDVEFENLITSEQVKDLIQYEVARERNEKKEKTNLL